MIRKHVLAASIVALALAASAGFAEEPKELTVFTASSLTGAFTEMGQLFENQTGIDVVFNFDGSQSLRTQIENGAYADVFASANTRQMNALRGDQLMNNGSIVIFAENKISLVVPKGNPAKISNLTDLAEPGLKIVMGTKDVPVGDYALKIINRLGNDSAYGPDYKVAVLANVISQETNVNYVVTKVALGEADVGFAYVSDVTRDLAFKVDKIDILDEYNVIAEYPIGVLSESKYPGESQDFIDLVRSGEGKAILVKYGFSEVHSSPAAGAANAAASKAAA